MHNANNLVQEMYTENALYYNHKPIDIGVEQIAKTYSYMNRPQYKLHLEVLKVVPVNKHIVYEIGQCSGSYRGKYVIIWQKTSKGWQVLLDTNI